MKTARDIVGEWQDSGFDSELIIRCREAWETPINELSDEMLATFLSQKIALQYVITEANRRIEQELYDGTEIYEGELKENLHKILTN